MSFGLLKHFKDLKKASSELTKTYYSSFAILGQDLGAVLKLLETRRQHPTATVKLISPRIITREFLLENYQNGVAQIRSEESVTAILRKHHNVKLSPQMKDALFYKEGKFHDFHGRAKSMDLLHGESFFTKKGYRLELSSLFAAEEWENLDSILRECQEVRILEAVEKTEPAELVERKEWKLSFRDFSVLNCENLIVCMSPKKFLNLLQHKEKLSPELIQLCTSVGVQTGITLTWKLSKEIHSDEQTLFIPQSMTHEWGHFIMDFEAFDHQEGTQTCHILFLIHEEEPQTEDLATKIKLMKRVIDRVFPHIEESILKEYIRFDDELLISGVKDDMLEQVGFDYPHLKFAGQVGPADTKGENFLSRILLN